MDGWMGGRYGMGWDGTGGRKVWDTGKKIQEGGKGGGRRRMGGEGEGGGYRMGGEGVTGWEGRELRMGGRELRTDGVTESNPAFLSAGNGAGPKQEASALASVLTCQPRFIENVSSDGQESLERKKQVKKD
jgi:hypothetical protein